MEILLEKVGKTFNPGELREVKALVDIDLEIERGEVVCLKGSSGSGKTTLLSIVGCIYGPSTGGATIGGKKLARLPDHFMTMYRREMIGFVHQNFNLLDNMTVLENVCLPLLPLGFSPQEQRKRAIPLLEQLSIQHRMDFPTNQISGGEVQRVAIARALINSPKIFLADEPTAHLDHQLSLEFMRIVEELKNQNKTIVLTSHDPLIYEHPVVERVIHLDQGRICGYE